MKTFCVVGHDARQRAAGLFLVGAAVAASGHKGRSDSDYRNFQ